MKSPLREETRGHNPRLWEDGLACTVGFVVRKPKRMENAGRGLAELSLHLLGSEIRDAKIAVLAGAGGNGGGAGTYERFGLRFGSPFGARSWVPLTTA